MLEGNVNAGRALQGKVKPLDIIYTDAYELAVKNGFQGTIDEWLESIKGDKGEPGKSIIPVTAPVFEDLFSCNMLIVGDLYLINESDEIGIARGYRKGDIFQATGVRSFDWKMNIIGDKGDKGDKGEAGQDYVLTADDKEEIADRVFEEAKPYIDNYMAAGILEARVG